MKGRTSTDVVQVDIGPFLKWLGAILAMLFATSVIGLFRMNSNVTRLTVKMEGVEQFIEGNTEAITTARAQIQALQILVERFNTNHTTLRRDVDALDKRLREVEKGT